MVQPPAVGLVVTRRMMPAVAALTIAMSVGAAGCGGGDGNASVETGGATTFPPPATVAITTTTEAPTPEEGAALALCDAMHTIGVTQFIGEEYYDFPDSFQVRTGQTSVIQCAINSGFRSISVSVTDYTDVAGATNEFENSLRGSGGKWDSIDGLGDRASIDVPDATTEDKSAAVRLILGTRLVSVFNISGLDARPDRAALREFATAIAAAL